MDQALELVLVVGQKAELRQTEREVRLIENTHDDRFAMVGRHRVHAEVEIAPVDLHLDTAVLRDALLGDFHLRHDLETRKDRALQTLRRRVHLAEGSVDAIAHAEFLLHRLKMDIGTLHLDRIGDEHRAKPDDRRVVAIAVGILVDTAEFVVGTRLDRICAAGIQPLHRGVKLVERRENGLHVTPVEHVTQRIHGIVAHRIGERYGQRIIIAQHRHHAILARQLGRKYLRNFRIDRARIDMAVFDTELLGYDSKHIV